MEDSVDLNRWRADVGSINVSAGELQITGPAYDPTDADGAYIGIQGNIVVDGGSLVFGRRTLIDGGLVGGSITSAGVETISGVHVVLNGDYRDRKSVVYGMSVSVSVDIGGRRTIKKTKRIHEIYKH